MGNRLTKIYTRTGDDGTTALASGKRISKSDLRLIVMGDVDELNAHIGMVFAQMNNLINGIDNKPNMTDNVKALMQHRVKHITVIQHLLFNIGGELAMPEYTGIGDAHIIWLEKDIDAMNQHLSPLKDFILPAGTMLVSQIHVCRTVCRRAERQAIALKETDAISISKHTLKILNRLSDWLFVLSRYCAKLEASSEVLWNKAVLDDIK